MLDGDAVNRSGEEQLSGSLLGEHRLELSQAKPAWSCAAGWPSPGGRAVSDGVRTELVCAALDSPDGGSSTALNAREGS